MKKLIALLGAVVLTASGVPVAEIPQTVCAEEMISGKKEDGITWELAGDTLRISGSGTVCDGCPFPKNIMEQHPFELAYFDQFYNMEWDGIAEKVRRIEINEGITALSNMSFCLFPILETVVLPDSLEKLRSYAFAGCPNLQKVEGGGNITFVGENVFYGDDKLCSKEQPFFTLGSWLVQYGGDASELVIPDTIQTIGSAVFSGHAEIRSVSLPPDLQTISADAFAYCTGLTAIEIPETVTQIVGGAFIGCTRLTEINIPKQVEEIGANAFSGCTALTSLHLPEGIERICKDTFSSCTSLTTCVIPDSVERIEENAFADCPLLETVQLPETVQYIDLTAFSGCKKLRETHTKKGCFVLNGILLDADQRNIVCTIPEGTVQIANDALSRKKTVAFHCPASLRQIHEHAFANNTNLMCINLNDGCETIGENAFSGCSSLKSLTVPASVKEIGKQAECSIKDIYGTPGTAAEQFASENKIAFHNVSELANTGKDMTLDLTEDIWSFGNSRTAFGDSYSISEEDLQALKQYDINTDSLNGAWAGSCVGLSITAILVKNGIIQPEQLQDGAKTLSEIQPTENVLSFINYYQCLQGRNPSFSGYETEAQTVYRMIQIADEIPQGASPFLLVFATADGSHGVVGYGREYGPWIFDGKTYDSRILVWDSNDPNGLRNDSCLYYDSTTLDYCIPHYGVHVADGAKDNTAGIITVCNDLSVLNAFPHPLAQSLRGDINGDGRLTVSDAILLARICAEDTSIQNAQPQDMDGDGYITVSDITEILRILAHTAS